MKKIGYHYTSLENYNKIKLDGLTPYTINKSDIKEFFPNGITGVWLWDKNLTGDEHTGSILWQLMTKGSTNIVKLRVYYETDNLLTFHNTPVEILHDGKLGVWKYHSGASAVIVTKTILPKDITVEKEYDFNKIME